MLDRRNLYRSLNEFRAPGIWISGPAGAGKTSLARGYLRSGARNVLVHQVEPADADLASFFVFLGRSFARAFPGKKRLPRPGPEGPPNPSVFGRSFMDLLFERLPSPFALLVDDLHRIPGDCAAIDLLASAVDRLPPGGRMVFISRRSPPPSFARLLANGSLRMLPPERLRLDVGEARALARMMGLADPEAAERAQRLADGWAAGMVLILRHGGDDNVPRTYGSTEALFDYFMSEVFSRIDDQARDFLTRSAFLSPMTAAMAASQTGCESAGEVLARLCSENFFTTPDEGAEPRWSYHHLFQDFLLRHAGRTLPAPETARLNASAAGLLEAAGRFEEAAPRWLAAGRPDEIARMVCAHGQALLAQGRIGVIRNWIEALPEERLAKDPWLCFWCGMAAMFVSPAAGRERFGSALSLFRRRGDWPGAVFSCVAAIESFFVEFGDFSGCDPFLSSLEELLGNPPEEIPLQVELRVVGVLKVIGYRDPTLALLDPWIDRARALAVSLPDPADRLTAATGIMFKVLWDDPGPFRAIIDEGARCADAPGVPAPASVAWWLYESNYRVFRGEFDTARRVLERGLAACERHGLRPLESFLHRCMVYAAIAAGDVDLAGAAVDRAEAALFNRSGTDVMHLFHLKSQVALLRGSLSEAVSCMNASLTLAQGAAMPFGEAVVRIAAAGVCVEAGHWDEAEQHLAGADGLARRLGMGILPPVIDLVRAHMALGQGRLDLAEAPLGRAVGEMCRRGYLVWNLTMRPALASLLAGAALELGIERDFVLETIRARRLPPPPSAGDSWPWPVRIETLGGFALCLDGERAQIAGKEQNKPIELLKALICRGGGQVPIAGLADALWPDADGDAAEISFKTTLHRLRRLLRCGDALLVHGHRVSIDRARVFVDALAFLRECDEIEAGLGRAGGAGRAAAFRAAERLLPRYRGDFLPQDASSADVARMRDRLRLCHRRLASLIEGGHGSRV